MAAIKKRDHARSANRSPSRVLDWMLITGEGHLRLALSEYVDHYNTHRPHRTLRQTRLPGAASARSGTNVRGLRRDRLGGLIREHAHVASGLSVPTSERDRPGHSMRIRVCSLARERPGAVPAHLCRSPHRQDPRRRPRAQRRQQHRPGDHQLRVWERGAGNTV